MRRREFLAGAASAGVLGTAGVSYLTGFPSHAERPDHDPVTVAGVSATGSEERPIPLPTPDRITFVELFATTCRVCEAEMPELAAVAEERSQVRFVSVTAERSAVVDDDELADWWATHGGAWQLARDESYEFVRHYSRATPTAILFDGHGRIHWKTTGAKTAAEIREQIAAVESA